MSSIPDRPCTRCDTRLTAENVIDSWGDNPHSMQVLCYECPDCETVTGYFRTRRHPDDIDKEPFVDREFVCPSRSVYARLFGETDAFHVIEPEETLAVPDDVYDSLHDRIGDIDIPLIEIQPRSIAENEHTVRRGATIVLPSDSFEALHTRLFGRWNATDEDWTGDWYTTENIRFVREGSDAEAYHNPDVEYTDSPD